MKPIFKHHSLRHIPISKRIFLLILIISILPITVVGNFSFFQAKGHISDLSTTYNNNLLKTICSNINLIFEDYITLSDELMLDSTVRNTLVSFDTLTPDEKFDVTLNIHSTIRSKFTRIENVYNIKIITTSNIPIYNSGFLFLEDASNEEIFDRIRLHDSSSLWYIAEYSGKPYFVLSRKIKELSSGKDIGYIIMHIKPSALKETMSSFDENTSFILADSYNQTFSSTNESDILSNETLEYISAQPSKQHTISYTDTNNYSVSYTSLDRIGWKLISCVPYSFLTAPIKSVRTGILLVILISIVFSIVISRYIWRSISIPLGEMIHSIENVSKVSFKTHSIQTKDDELEFLTDAYNKIINKMEEMTIQIENEQEQKELQR